MADLDAAVIILESSDPDTLGDLSLFHDVARAQDALEAIDVRNGEYFGFTLGGRPLRFTTDGQRVRIEVDSSQANEVRVRSLLERHARLCFKGKAVFEDFSQYSLVGLVEVIGFRR